MKCLITLSTRYSINSVFVAVTRVFENNYMNQFREYWYIGSTTLRSEIEKNRIDPR